MKFHKIPNIIFYTHSKEMKSTIPEIPFRPFVSIGDMSLKTYIMNSLSQQSFSDKYLRCELKILHLTKFHESTKFTYIYIYDSMHVSHHIISTLKAP